MRQFCSHASGRAGDCLKGMTDIDIDQPRIGLVTGGSSGIGRHTAIRLAQRATRVVVTYNNNPDGAAETVATIEREGGSALALALDIGHSEMFDAFAGQLAGAIEERWDRTTFDVLVNNAGASVVLAPFADVTEELLDASYRILFKGPYLLTQRLLPLLADHGAIVNVASTAGLVTGTASDCTAYGSMKGGLITLSRTLAKELSRRGIRVNTVAPGPTRTRFAGDAFERHPEIIPAIVERIALGRLGDGDDVAKVIATVASEDCGWVTGETIEVSGGLDL
jgi:NAD(P)-dependent dehydrogenase (short-subunit alcohol dehydrogenase family)